MIKEDHEKMIRSNSRNEQNDSPTQIQALSLIEEEGSFIDTSEGHLTSFIKKINGMFNETEGEKDKMITSDKMKSLADDFEKFVQLQCEFKPQHINEFAMILSGMNCCLLDHRNVNRTDMKDFIQMLDKTMGIAYHLQNHMGSENAEFDPPINRVDGTFGAEIQQYIQNFFEEDGTNSINQPIELQILKVVKLNLKLRQMFQSKMIFDDQRIVETLTGVLRSMVNRLNNVIRDYGSIRLSITNHIAKEAMEIAQIILTSERMSEEYWKLASNLNEDPFALSFYSTLLAWNCRVNFTDPNAQISRVSVVHYLGRMRRFQISKSSRIEGPSVDLKLIPDPKISDGQSLLNLLDDYILVTLIKNICRKPNTLL